MDLLNDVSLPPSGFSLLNGDKDLGDPSKVSLRKSCPSNSNHERQELNSGISRIIKMKKESSRRFYNPVPSSRTLPSRP